VYGRAGFELLAATLLSLAAMAARGAEDDEGFVPLFNGKDLTGWTMRGYKKAANDQWTVRDGVLAAKPGSGWLGTEKMYGDFVLRLEWRVPTNGNSGVYLRVPDIETDTLPTWTGVEVQILDDDGPAYKGKIKDYQHSGSIYEFVPAGKRVYKGAGEWNRFEITCKGERISVVYNGEKVAEAYAAKDAKLAKRPRKGFIGLQYHETAVEFRNISIRVLDK
jgi:hypothetical protein